MSKRKKLKMVSSTTASTPVPVAPSAAPDPEVRAVAKRRQFTAAYKLSVVEEADRCSSPGAIARPARLPRSLVGVGGKPRSARSRNGW